jgi:UDP-N-acetylmuramate: L-alanyl-gamma-D-glutamyl-meso-diaminopimelate ligase
MAKSLNIHILGIAGQGMTTPLALELKKKGNIVSGSDQTKIFPPASTQLETSKIPINVTPITKKIDLIIVGSAYQKFPNCVEEYEQAKRLGIPTISATEFVANTLIKDNSIVVAGSYGKTTITALLSWIFHELDFKPNYFFGGQSLNNQKSLEMNQSDWSIVEGDESINGLDTQAKFSYFYVKHLIITSVNWEHKDSYSSLEENHKSYMSLLERVPPNGVIVYNPNDPVLTEMVKSLKANTIAYQDYAFNTTLIGQHNHDNINAALTLCDALGMDMSKVIPLISQFKGIKRRLEILSKANNILFIDDFAQSPVRIKSAIESIKSSYKHRPIKVYFEPHATFLQFKDSLRTLNEAFASTKEVVISKIKYSKNISKEHRSTAKDYLDEIGQKTKYLPINDEIYQHFTQTLRPNDILVHFSTGGLDGTNNLNEIITYFTKS